MAHKILALVHTFQSVLAAYNLYLSSISISNLLGYEDKAKKAAEYSNIADHQLYKTRVTQASGTISVVISLLSSVTLLFNENSSTTTKLAVAGVNLAVLGAAREHVSSYWKSKVRVPLPGTGDYNEAISKTTEVRLNMLYLIMGWGVSAVVGLIL